MANAYKETIHDYRILYEGCLVTLSEAVIKKYDVAPLALVRSFEGEDDYPSSVNLYAYKLKEVDLGVTTDPKSINVKLDEIDFSVPEFGFVNTGRSAFRVFKIKPSGNAKYRKLPVLSDIRVDNPVSSILARLQLNPVDNIKDYDVLTYWNSMEYSQPQEALQSLFNGESIARAISNKFCFFVSDKSNKVFLGYDEYVAGHVESPDSPIVLQPWAKRFGEELEAFGLAVK